MKQRFIINTGEHAGKIFEGVGCNARPYPNCPESEINWEKYKNGIWIPELNMRIPKERKPDMKHCGDYLHYTDLIIPFDKYGNEIFVGDKLYISAAKEVRKVEVKKIGKEYHVGCGWMQRKLTVTDLDSNQTLTVNIPVHTIKVMGE